MGGRRFLYLTVLLGCGVFYIAYGEWMAWVILVFAALAPWLSLLLSLPAIRRFRLDPGGPEKLLMGTEGKLWLLGSCPDPMPPFRGNLRLENAITGEVLRYEKILSIPTAHCGAWRVRVEKARVWDYLGLFSFRVKAPGELTVRIRPRELPLPPMPDLQKYLARSWRPKFGGGFAENHELRLYRPGDGLNQVHWKLSAKTGKLMIREPLEPVRGQMLVTLDHGGSPEEVDRKLGRLLSLGKYLVQHEAVFELRVLTGTGMLSFPIRREAEVFRAVDTLLRSPAVTGDTIQSRAFQASWHCHIGGDADEA